MKANAQLIAMQLQSVAEALRSDPLLARDVAAAMGWDTRQFSVVIDAIQFRKAVDDAVAAALDKRASESTVIASTAAREVVEQSAAKLERIANDVFKAHLAPQAEQTAAALTRSISSATQQQSNVAAACNEVIERANAATGKFNDLLGTIQRKADEAVAKLQTEIQQRLLAVTQPELPPKQ